MPPQTSVLTMLPFGLQAPFCNPSALRSAAAAILAGSVSVGCPSTSEAAVNNTLVNGGIIEVDSIPEKLAIENTVEEVFE